MAKRPYTIHMTHFNSPPHPGTRYDLHVPSCCPRTAAYSCGAVSRSCLVLLAVRHNRVHLQDTYLDRRVRVQGLVVEKGESQHKQTFIRAFLANDCGCVASSRSGAPGSSLNGIVSTLHPNLTRKRVCTTEGGTNVS